MYKINIHCTRENVTQSDKYVKNIQSIQIKQIKLFVMFISAVQVLLNSYCF